MQCPKCKSSEYLSSTAHAKGDELVTTYKCSAPEYEIFNRRGDPVVDEKTGKPVPVLDDNGEPKLCNTEWDA